MLPTSLQKKQHFRNLMVRLKQQRTPKQYKAVQLIAPLAQELDRQRLALQEDLTSTK